MTQLITLRSKLDASVNMVEQLGPKEAFECRYVRRADDYFIAYISSQSACSQGCRMCHLTTTGQTVPTNATHKQMVEQASKCWSKYFEACDGGVPRARIVHFNFMARGEPLVNPHVDSGLLLALGQQSAYSGLISRFMISTIMPVALRKEETLAKRFPLVHPEICYSMYSVNPEFRKKWLPAALPVDEALEMLQDYQFVSSKIVKVHYALIKGQNDSLRDIQGVAQAIRRKNLRVNVNLVQYNPPDDKSEAADEDAYNKALWTFRDELPEAQVKIVPRVGYDVQASCGMFVNNGGKV